MAAVNGFELFAVDLPFRKPFTHAAASRTCSESLFLKCSTDAGVAGFGETLPRTYVTGESRDSAFAMLRDDILPRLLGMRFDSLQDVIRFLEQCDGLSPGWVDAGLPQAAAWCVVDLALLDAFGRTFGGPAPGGATAPLRSGLRYSGVLSPHTGWRLTRSALRQWLFGIRSIKLKVDAAGGTDALRRLRRLFGRTLDLRVDANMVWERDREQAKTAMLAMARHGVRSFEQPLAADDIDGLAWLVGETRLGVMADESLTTRASLQALVAANACTAANVRIAKCGGLIAACNRAREALAAGLTLQVGCQVGESSLLSAAHLKLLQTVQPVTYAEGCFGRFLLREDPAAPVLQFGYGGRPPQPPHAAGLGVTIREDVLQRWITQKAVIA